jgi:hypothetical protein
MYRAVAFASIGIAVLSSSAFANWARPLPQSGGVGLTPVACKIWGFNQDTGKPICLDKKPATDVKAKSKPKPSAAVKSGKILGTQRSPSATGQAAPGGSPRAPRR